MKFSFIFAGLIDTIKQRRVIKSRERAALHSLRLAKIQAQIAAVQADSADYAGRP
jgi:hypothetical protein